MERIIRSSFLLLLILLLAFSQLFTSITALSFSRAQRLLQQGKSLEGLGSSLHEIAQMSSQEAYKAKRDELINWRMDIEINDYPVPGPNNHHTPPRPPGRD